MQQMDLDVAKIIEQTESDHYRRYIKYEDTILVTGVLKIMISSSPELGFPPDLVSIGRKLNRHDQGKAIGDIRPDMIAVHVDSDTGLRTGIVFEMKWDVSDTLETVRDEIAKMKRYFAELSGFPPELSRLSSDHDVLLIAPRAETRKFEGEAKGLLAEEQEGYSYLGSNRFAILAWDVGKDKYRIERYHIEKKYGKIQCESFENCLGNPNRCAVDSREAYAWRARVYAVADTPPIIHHAWTVMRALAALFTDRRQNEVILSEEDIFSWLNSQFGPLTKWSPPQVLRDDLGKALRTLVQIDFNLFYAEGSNSEERNPKYRIVHKMPKNKDLAAWLANKLAKMEVSKLQGPKRRIRRGKPRRVRPGSGPTRGRPIEDWR